jgi:hypothetical protein
LGKFGESKSGAAKYQGLTRNPLLKAEQKRIAEERDILKKTNVYFAKTIEQCRHLFGLTVTSFLSRSCVAGCKSIEVDFMLGFKSPARKSNLKSAFIGSLKGKLSLQTNSL